MKLLICEIWKMLQVWFCMNILYAELFLYCLTPSKQHRQFLLFGLKYPASITFKPGLSEEIPHSLGGLSIRVSHGWCQPFPSAGHLFPWGWNSFSVHKMWTWDDFLKQPNLLSDVFHYWFVNTLGQKILTFSKPCLLKSDKIFFN